MRILPDDSPSQGTAERGFSAYAPQIPAESTQRGTTRQLDREAAPVAPSPLPAGPPAAQRSRFSTCSVVAVTVGLLALTCMLLAYATLREGVGGLGNLRGLIPSINFGLVTTPTVTIDTSRPSVVEQVKALSKLETVHYQVEKVITGASTGPLPAPLTGDKILLVAHGEVVGGIDLDKLNAEDVVEAGSAVTLSLPAPEILYSKLDNDKTYVYDRQTGIFSKPDPNLESQMRSAAEKAIVQSAQEDGILQEARTNAEQTLRTLLTGLGYKDVNFKEAP